MTRCDVMQEEIIAEESRQRRAAEREGRRRRRQQARKTQAASASSKQPGNNNLGKHAEGMSSDDELSTTDALMVSKIRTDVENQVPSETPISDRTNMTTGQQLSKG